MRYTFCLVCLVAVGCGRSSDADDYSRFESKFPSTNKGTAPHRPPTEVAADPQPDYPEAVIVKQYVLDHANEPSGVQFVKWYSKHDGAGLTYQMVAERPSEAGKIISIEEAQARMIRSAYEAQRFNDGKPWVMVRVRFRSRNDHGHIVLEDKLFYLASGKVLRIENNEFKGDLLDPRDKGTK